MPETIEVPDGLRRFGRWQREGPAGRRWLESLPGLVEHHRASWGLSLDGAVMHGDNGIAVPVRRGAETLVLKVGWPDPLLAGQVTALCLWQGHGGVRLLDASPDGSVQLLERLDAGRSLADLPLQEALPIIGAVLRRLAVPVATSAFPTTWDEAARGSATVRSRWLRLGRPFPETHLRAALAAADSVSRERPSTLVDRDLSYEHVLADPRGGWSVIDGMPVVGCPEVQVGQLLWTRYDDVAGAGGTRACLATLVEAANLDPALAEAWLVVRCTDYALWGLEVGFTQDPPRCRAILDDVIG